MRALGKRGKGIVPRRFKALLDDEGGDRLWPSFARWLERASAADIVAAYEICRNPHVRGILCDKVRRRRLHEAVPMLVHALGDLDIGVRAEAADALGTIGDPGTGHDLLQRYVVEDDAGVRQTLLLGLGSTGHRPALPFLVEALRDGNDMMRDCAAFALKNLGANEALPALRQALADEPDAYNARTMQFAIDILEGDWHEMQDRLRLTWN